MRSTVTPAVDLRPLSIERLRDTPKLWQAQWEETAREKELMTLDPDWATYERLEQMGLLLGVGMFDQEELVGYSLGMVAAHLNSRPSLHYSSVQFYVQPDHLGAGRMLYNETRLAAADRGATFILWRAKPGSLFERLLLSWAVLDAQEHVYSEKL